MARRGEGPRPWAQSLHDRPSASDIRTGWPSGATSGMLGWMERIVLALVLAGVALGVAAVLQRRQRTDAPLRTGYTVPDQLDRDDFDRPDAAWLVAVFTSATCDACHGVWERAQP